MIRRLAVAALAVAALALGACSQEAPSFEDLTALEEAVAEAGVSCGRIVPLPPAELVSDGGSCTDSELTLYLFDDAGDAADWEKVAARLRPTATGPGWAVTGDGAAVGRVAEHLGADLAGSS